ncbi:TetR/AcrR family transcriptional regulator [Paractinoplanes atraurantiacus]|uniref:Regulatory protein, tetR family n=1 Tax=Paractinoplanes atraurantiacus TaxID=1036182 RepID=A0A285K7L7_9ACTN|nr:TetR family transcriptional regulator [Actinoplanes atraurantiacus]SNY67486.1 regulatory protein, tetR family [Actinoplanes atraurantiacus]
MREAIRAELTAAALRSIDEVGFAATTASAIAASVGVTERTFFRYFPTKEDAVLQPIEALGPAIAGELRRRPASESPAQSLRAAFEVAVEWVTADPVAMTTVMRLNRDEPALRGRHLQQQDLWVSALAEALGGSPRSRMECGLMMLAWEKALTSCYDRGDFSRAGAELDAALEELRSFLGSAQPRPST